FTHATHLFAQQPAAQQPAGPTLDRLKAKDFTVKTLDGESVALNKLLGEGKPVLIDFWATWCGPCRMVIRHLNAVHRQYGKDGLIVIGMNLENPAEDQQAVKSFVKRYQMDYKVVFAPQAIYQFFSGRTIARIPNTLVFDPDGTLIWRLVGYSPQMGSALNGAVAKAMARAPEKRAEQRTPEKQTEQGPAERPAEQVAPEKQTEQRASEKPAQDVTPEKPAQNVTPEKPAEQGAPEKQTEQGAPEKPAQQAPPATKTCNCPCCSSHAPEK